MQAQLLKQLQRLLQLVQRGDFVTAAQLSDQLLSHNLVDRNFYHASAMAYLNVGAHNKALKQFTELVKLLPQHHGIHNIVADLNAKAGNAELADKHFSLATTLAPQVSEYWFNWGLAAAAIGEFDNAAIRFEHSLEKQPDFTKAKVELIRAYNQLFRYEAAADLFETFSDQNMPWHLWMLKGDTLEGLTLLDEAQNAFQNALKLNPQQYEIYEALAQNALLKGEKDSAINWVKKGLKALPDSRQLLRLQANLCHELDIAKSTDVYEKVIDQKTSPELFHDAIEQAILAKDFTLAESWLAAFKQTVQTKPERTFFSECLLLIQQNRHSDVIQLITKQNLSFQPLFWRFLAQSYLALGEYKQANVFIDKMIERDPHDQYLWALKGSVLKHSNPNAYHELFDFQRLVKFQELQIDNNYSSIESFNNELKTELKGLHVTNVNPLNQSGVGGTQTPGYLFNHKSEILVDLKRYLLKTAESMLADITNLDKKQHPVTSRYKSNLKMVTAWSMWLKSGGFHKSHCHSKGWYSSAYYVSLPDFSDQNDSGSLVLGQSGVTLPQLDQPDRIITPKTGHLALFPSMFWHGTKPFESQEPRVVVAFDLMPTD